jgi:hypothetical protein
MKRNIYSLFMLLAFSHAALLFSDEITLINNTNTRATFLIIIPANVKTKVNNEVTIEPGNGGMIQAPCKFLQLIVLEKASDRSGGRNLIVKTVKDGLNKHVWELQGTCPAAGKNPLIPSVWSECGLELVRKK